MTRIVVATTAGLYDVAQDSPFALEGKKIGALSRDGRWAIIDHREVWNDLDGWARIASANGERLTSFLPADDGTVIGTDGAHLLHLRGSDLVSDEAFESVEGREEWFTPWGGPPDVRSMTRLDSVMFVNVHVGGIVRSVGESKWEPTVEIGTDVHEVKAAGDAVIAACAVGFASSTALGTTWEFDDVGLHATYARAVAASSEWFFMSVAHGPRGGDAAIYRKARHGSTGFARCDLPSFSDNIDTGCLEATDDLVAFGTRDGDVFTSFDQGMTWQRAASGLPSIRGIALLG